MAKSSRFALVGLAFTLLAGCPDEQETRPEDEAGDDAGQSVDPSNPGDEGDAAVVDARVADKQDAASDARVVVDAAPQRDAAPVVSERDAQTDAQPPVNEPDAGPVKEVTFADAYAVMAKSCTGCHGAGKTLDLSTQARAYEGLVNVDAAYAACASTDSVRVVPGDAEASLLIAKLEGTQSCGNQMPPKALLPESEIATVRAWVEAGANQ